MPEELEVSTPAEEQESQAAPSSEEQNESTESAAGEQEQEEPPGEGETQKSKGGFQRRIDKLTKEKSDAERTAEFWRQEALRNRPANEAKPEEQPKTPERPKPEDFANPDEYVDALTDWKLDRRDEERAKKDEKEAEVRPLFEARDRFAATVDDYHDTMKAATNVPVTPNMLPYLQDPEIGPELGYFLAKNPDEAVKLSKMGPVIMAQTILEMRSRFKPDAPSTKTATVSKAPPPPSPIGKQSPSSTKDPGEMSPAEYRAWHAKAFPDDPRNRNSR